MKYKPVIVVVAYNRPRSIGRLLSSLKNAKNISQAKLIISIDNNAPHNYDVKEIAENFEWPFGDKEVVYQEQHLGLKKHVLTCGDLSKTYGSVIMLEDDLYVSPYFYDYAIKALEFYENDETIGGISLYNLPREDITESPFYPVNDESDIYFMQYPSSLGQSWSKNQWTEFREWLDKDPDITQIPLPTIVINWPETSWKKYFYAFLIEKHKYFVFPRTSLTTNFNDPGTHMSLSVNHDGQTQLRTFGPPYRFKRKDDSNCLYDAYFEMLPECVKEFSPQLRDFDFTMDLYGLKELGKIEVPYIITSRPVKDYIYSYKRTLKPHEMNILFQLNGDELFLCRKEDVLPVKNKYSRINNDYKYYYKRNLIGWKVLLYNYYMRFKLKS